MKIFCSGYFFWLGCLTISTIFWLLMYSTINSKDRFLSRISSLFLSGFQDIFSLVNICHCPPFVNLILIKTGWQKSRVGDTFLPSTSRNFFTGHTKRKFCRCVQVVEFGRHASLRCLWKKFCGGSSPPLGKTAFASTENPADE